MKKLFLYVSLFLIAFLTGYLIGYEKYKDFQFSFPEGNETGIGEAAENIAVFIINNYNNAYGF